MSKKHNIQAVVLSDDGYKMLGKLIEPYVQEGSTCKYIHCRVAEQVGSFLVMEFSPEMCSGRVKDNMSISVPIGLVLFMASGIDELTFGFKQL